MRFAHRASWSISIGGSLHQLVALYVRDSLGLRPQTDPAIPPLTATPPAAQPLAAAEEAVVSAQWAQWWNDLLPAVGEPPRPPLPATLADTAELAGYPELRAVVRANLPDPRWTAARGHEDMVLMTEQPRRRQLFETNLVADIEAERRQAARPFSLRITVLPVQTMQGWRISPHQVMMTRSLFADQAAYERLLRPIVAELA
jgi:hypothetical protein